MNIMVLGGGTEEDGHEVWHRMTVAVMHTKAWEEAGPYGGVGVSSKAQVPSSKKNEKDSCVPFAVARRHQCLKTGINGREGRFVRCDIDIAVFLLHTYLHTSSRTAYSLRATIGTRVLHHEVSATDNRPQTQRIRRGKKDPARLRYQTA